MADIKGTGTPSIYVIYQFLDIRGGLSLIMCSFV